MLGEDAQTLSFRGRRSRNKVSVGEPAEGSLSFLHPHPCVLFARLCSLSPCVRFGRLWRWRVSLSIAVSVCPRVGGAPCFGRPTGRAGQSLAVLSPPPLASCARAWLCARACAGRVDPIKYTTLVDGYLGMSNDEERSEMRYVVRIAEFSESSNL